MSEPLTPTGIALSNTFGIDDIELLMVADITPEVLKEIQAELIPAWTRAELESGRVIKLPEIVRRHYKELTNAVLVDIEWLFKKKGWVIKTERGLFSTFKPIQTPKHLA